MAPKAPTVEAFIAALTHPKTPEVIALRALILAVDPAVSEEVKWNAPSFRTTEHFATMNLRATDHLLLILHRGAKKRPVSDVPVADPDGLLTWLGPDRASVTIRSVAELEARRSSLEALLREWIRTV